MWFGQNLIARNSGVIRVGDEVEILATAPAKAYGAGSRQQRYAGRTPGRECNHRLAGANLLCRNNQQVLLEQLENQGFVFRILMVRKSAGCCRIRCWKAK